MRQFSLSELCEPLAGNRLGDDARFDAVSTDSRSLQSGELFVALKGENFDGHRFIEVAAAAGACAAIVSESVASPLPLLQVADTERALGQLAALNRREFPGTLVGITGSCGKTSVKNMLSAIFQAAGNTLATQGNFNNEIGLPLTLLELDPTREFAVIEMGAARPGDIAYLCEIAQPRIAVLLNALPAHLETMGSIEGVARTKGEILAGLGAEGTAVYPADSPFTTLWRDLAGAAQRLEFGFDDSADVRASAVELDAESAQFTLHLGDDTVAVDLPLPGRHSVANALAAAAAAFAAGLSPAAVATGLAAASATEGRLQRRRLAGDIALIDDSYNANPASVKVAIDVLAEAPGRHILVLGTMAELGEGSDALHGEVGSYAAERGIEALWATGLHTQASVEAFGVGGRSFESRSMLAAALADFLQSGDTVLVKGSRSAGMEAIVATLEQGGAD
jgi:UDP-N-acetylmuramoyl-tripeptide--D-alanyl-D-alanine ligase